MDFESLGGRKFLLVLLVTIASTTLTWFTKIDAATYSLVTIGIVGAFITGNVIQTIKTTASTTSIEVKPNEPDK